MNQIRTNKKKKNKLYNENYADIRADSLLIARVTSAMVVSMMFLLSLISFLLPAFYQLRTAYLMGFGVAITLFGIYELFKKKLSPLIYLYILFFGCVGYATIVSCFYGPNEKAVTILAVLLTAPTIILNKTRHMVVLELLGILFYMQAVWIYKSPTIIVDELIDVVIFSIMGLVLGHYLKLNKLMNFDLKRKAVLEKNTDYLTNLFNRLKLFDDLSKEEKKQTVISVMMIDIDKFKIYNDVYGHQAGDEALRKISDCFRKFGKKHDLVFYRYGGEEFVALVHCNDPEQMQILGEKINQEIEHLKIPHKQSKFEFVTLSVGYAVGDQEKQVNYELLISQADLALYYAKQTGRNQTVGYHPNMLEERNFDEMKDNIGKLQRKRNT